MRFNIIASVLAILSVILYGEIVLKDENKFIERKNQKELFNKKYSKISLPNIKEDRSDMASIKKQISERTIGNNNSDIGSRLIFIPF